MKNDPLTFPKDFRQKYPFQLREIFDFLQGAMTKADLAEFLSGKLYSEKIINMYFKVLEKMNLVQLSMDNYMRQQQVQETPDGYGNSRVSASSNLLVGSNTMKIQFMSTHFVKKLHEIDEFDDKVDQNLLQYYNHDLVLLPFFFEQLDQTQLDPTHEHETELNSETGLEDYICGCSTDKRAILVSVKVLDNQVDLFDIEFRDHDSKYPSQVSFGFPNLLNLLQTMIFLTACYTLWTTHQICTTLSLTKSSSTQIWKTSKVFRMTRIWSWQCAISPSASPSGVSQIQKILMQSTRGSILQMFS